MRVKKVFLALGAGSLVVASVAGCVQMTHVPTGRPVVIQRDGSNLKVVVCEDLEISGLAMDEREYPSPWRTFWEFDQALNIHAGEELSPSLAEQLGVSAGHEPGMSANREIAINFRVDPYVGDDNYAFSVSFLIGEKGLSESKWLHDDGSETLKPCG